MRGTAYRIGQLLALADHLHIQYCRTVRKGQIPPQLVGNALMPMALEQPVKALAMLSRRIVPYKAWAATVQEGDNVALVKYLLGQFGRIAPTLDLHGLPVTCSDLDKAEMLLGYLAHPEKSGDSEPSPAEELQ